MGGQTLLSLRTTSPPQVTIYKNEESPVMLSAGCPYAFQYAASSTLQLIGNVNCDAI